MSNEEKILFLEKLFTQASKKLKQLGCKNNKFFVVNSYYYPQFFEIGTNDNMLKLLVKNRLSEFRFIFKEKHMFQYSTTTWHSMKAIINWWKSQKNKVYEDFLLGIVAEMEKVTSDGYEIAIKSVGGLISGIVLWHAKVPIEQLAIELDMMS